MAFTSAWLYAGTNVMNRKLKDLNFTVLGFYHPFVGLIIALTFIIGQFLVTGMYFEAH